MENKMNQQDPEAWSSPSIETLSIAENTEGTGGTHYVDTEGFS